MDDDKLKQLNEKLLKARGLDSESLQNKEKDELDTEARKGIQAGVELIGAIFIPTAVGYFLDGWLETRPAFMLILFFLGICTGFYNVYRISKNMGTAVGNKKGEKDK